MQILNLGTVILRFLIQIGVNMNKSQSRQVEAESTCICDPHSDTPHTTTQGLEELKYFKEELETIDYLTRTRAYLCYAVAKRVYDFVAVSIDFIDFHTGIAICGSEIESTLTRSKRAMETFL